MFFFVLYLHMMRLHTFRSVFVFHSESEPNKLVKYLRKYLGKIWKFLRLVGSPRIFSYFCHTFGIHSSSSFAPPDKTKTMALKQYVWANAAISSPPSFLSLNLNSKQVQESPKNYNLPLIVFIIIILLCSYSSSNCI